MSFTRHGQHHWWKRHHGGVVPPSLPWMQVATRAQVANVVAASTQYMMARSYHFTRDTVVALKLVFVGQVGAIDAASIEYPAGTFTQAKWSGATSVTVGASRVVVSDPIIVSIPANTKFWVRRLHTSPNTNGVGTGCKDVANGDALTFSTTAVTDRTMTGTVGDSGGTLGLYPDAILAQTAIKSVYCLGDSRCMGLNDTGDMGEVTKQIAPTMACINGGLSGEKAANFVNSYPQYQAIIPYCTHLVSQFCINDNTGGAGAVTVMSAQFGIHNLFPTIPFYLCTIPPYVGTSTDGWTTLGGQTIDSHNAARVAYNVAVRAKPAWVTGVFDNAIAVENGVNSGVWAVVPGRITQDGLHENSLGYLTIFSAGTINTSAFI